MAAPSQPDDAQSVGHASIASFETSRLFEVSLPSAGGGHTRLHVSAWGMTSAFDEPAALTKKLFRWCCANCTSRNPIPCTGEMLAYGAALHRAIQTRLAHLTHSTEVAATQSPAEGRAAPASTSSSRPDSPEPHPKAGGGAAHDSAPHILQVPPFPALPPLSSLTCRACGAVGATSGLTTARELLQLTLPPEAAAAVAASLQLPEPLRATELQEFGFEVPRPGESSDAAAPAPPATPPAATPLDTLVFGPLQARASIPDVVFSGFPRVWGAVSIPFHTSTGTGSLSQPPTSPAATWQGGKGLLAMTALQRAGSKPEEDATTTSEVLAAASPVPSDTATALLQCHAQRRLHPALAGLPGAGTGFPHIVAVAYDPAMLAHAAPTQHPSASDSLPGVPLPPPQPHPERPDRLKAIVAHLAAMGLFQRCWRVECSCASHDALRTVHTPHLVDRVAATADAGPDGGSFGSDTYYCEHSYKAALLSAGGVLEVTRRVALGHATAGLALVRPPGHHAEPDAAMGFCLFNNVAVAAAVARREWGAHRVLILDWDVHHGNGTQNAFLDDPSVLYISLHRYDSGSFYPGTGDPRCVGEGAAAGTNVNIGWPTGGMGDAEYMAAFDAVVMPIARSFNPDLVLVSAGFDAAAGDPLGGCCVSPTGYAHMTAQLRTLAGGRVVVALEGGYNLHSISNSVAAVAAVLLGDPPPPFADDVSMVWGEQLTEAPNTPAHPASSEADEAALPPRQRSDSMGGLVDSSAAGREGVGGPYRVQRMRPDQAAASAIIRTTQIHKAHWDVLRSMRKASFRSVQGVLEARAARVASQAARAELNAFEAAQHASAGQGFDSAHAHGANSAVPGSGDGEGVLLGLGPAPSGPALDRRSSRFSAGSWVEGQAGDAASTSSVHIAPPNTPPALPHMSGLEDSPFRAASPLDTMPPPSTPTGRPGDLPRPGKRQRSL